MNRRDALATMMCGTMVLATDQLNAAEPSKDDVASARFVRSRRSVKTSLGLISYVDEGRGSVVLLLHGFPLSNFQWRDVIPGFSSERRCIAPDWLGLGRTKVVGDASVTPAAQSRMLVELLDALRITSVDIIANDSGGAVAQIFAVDNPGRVRTLLLTNCDVEPDSPPPALLPVIELAKRGTYADDWLVPWANDPKLARSPKGLGGMCFEYPNHPTDAAISEYLVPLVASAERKRLVNAYAIGLAPNPLEGITPRLASLTVPTAIVWGTADNIFSADSPEYLRRTLPRFQFVETVVGGKLFWPEERPDRVIMAAKRLWRNASAA